MGRKRFDKLNKSLLKSSRKAGNLQIMGMNVSDIFSIMDDGSSEAGTILLNIMITGVVMMSMSQIMLSAKPEGPEYVDGLPSYKDSKKKFLTGQIGRTLAASAGVAAAYPYLMQDPSMNGEDGAEKIIVVVADIVDHPSPNIKRIRPSQAEWQRFAKGEVGAAMGQIISCPSTSLKTINVDSKVGDYGVSEAIKNIGISDDTLNKYNITQDTIVDGIRGILLTDNSGIPIKTLEYNEPKIINSKIQAEILGESVCRTGEINTKLSKGLVPESTITKSLVEKYLNSREQIAYKFALNTGDKNILRKYTDMVKERAKEKPSE